MPTDECFFALFNGHKPEGQKLQDMTVFIGDCDPMQRRDVQQLTALRTYLAGSLDGRLRTAEANYASAMQILGGYTPPTVTQSHRGVIIALGALSVSIALMGFGIAASEATKDFSLVGRVMLVAGLVMTAASGLVFWQHSTAEKLGAEQKDKIAARRQATSAAAAELAMVGHRRELVGAIDEKLGHTPHRDLLPIFSAARGAFMLG